MVRTSVTHLAEPRVPLFCPFVHFDVICDLSLNRRTATWNLFVNFISVHRYQNSCAYQGREKPPSVLQIYLKGLPKSLTGIYLI